MWGSDDFVGKAMVYGRRASATDADEVARGLFLSICLEMLAKALLAKEHPAFIANTDKIEAALKTTSSPINAKTLPLSQVMDRLVIVHPGLRHRLVEDLKKFIAERNSEMHSSEHSFESRGEKQWLPLVVNGIGHLADLLGKSEHSFITAALILKSSDYQNQNSAEREARVDDAIKVAKNYWNGLPAAQKSLLSASAKVENYNERLACPACESNLTVAVGTNPIDSSLAQKNGELERLNVFEVIRVRCTACGFALNDPYEISFAGLPEEVSSTEVLSWDEMEGFFEEYGDD
jgi:hypothetical protein